MLGILLLTLLFAKKTSDELKENVELTVVMNINTEESLINDLKKTLTDNKIVKKVEYVSAEDVVAIFSKEIGKNVIEPLGFNPLGAELVVTLKSEYATDASLINLKVTLQKNSFVREVIYKLSMLDNINKNVRKITIIMLSILLVFFLISTALINGTIRLHIYSQRFIIKSMQLVGARNGFIIRPFIGRSLKSGFYGSIISWILLAGFLYAGYTYEPTILNYFTDIELAIIAGILLLIGLLFTLISSFFVTRKYLKLNIEQLY